MRYMTLTELLLEFRAEAGLSQNAAHGVHLDAPHRALLRRIQEQEWINWDWPHLLGSTVVDVPAGQRYTAYPAGVQFEGIRKVYGLNDGHWMPVRYGIEPVHLNRADSDAGVEDWPVERWQNYTALDGSFASNMFELWPVPEQATKIRFHGKRALGPLTDDAHMTTIDGPLIALAAAAEVLAKAKSEDAPAKYRAAAQRRNLLKTRQGVASSTQHSMA